MSRKILQVNYKFSIPRGDLEAIFLPAAQPIADTPGLRWKIWLVNEAETMGGGLYLFDDEAALQTFLEGPIVAGAATNAALGEFEARIFDISAPHTTITRGPVGDDRASFAGMAEAAYRAVPTIKAADLQRRLKKEPALLVVDVRDAADLAQTGTVPGAANISYGALTYMADDGVPEAWRDPRFADRTRPIVTTCILGPLGAIGGKLLHDMGFTDVQVLEGGVQAWIDAGLPVAKNGAQ